MTYPNLIYVFAHQFRDMLQVQMMALNDTFEPCSWYRDNWTEDRLILGTTTMMG